ncbi:hypothetical protein [Sphingomonas sp. UYP23]
MIDIKKSGHLREVYCRLPGRRYGLVKIDNNVPQPFGVFCLRRLRGDTCDRLRLLLGGEDCGPETVRREQPYPPQSTDSDGLVPIDWRPGLALREPGVAHRFGGPIPDGDHLAKFAASDGESMKAEISVASSSLEPFSSLFDFM